MLSVRHCAICDDVRREDNGKLIFIGVYGRDVRMLRPSKFALSLALDMTTDAPGSFELEFRSLVDGVTGSVQKGVLTVEEAGDLFFAVPALTADIKKSSKIEFQWKPDPKGDWQEIRSIPVLVVD